MVNATLATVPKTKEREVVERIKAALADGTRPAQSRRNHGRILLGIGDDSAILQSARGRNWATSTDFFLEGVHFLPTLHPPESIGFKALARAISDLAAIGAMPLYFLLSVALPDNRIGRWLDRMLRGMRKSAAKYGMTAIGGDTSSYPSTILSVTVIGEAVSGRNVVTRVGAKPGDAIYVSGTLGRAALGLELIRNGMGGSRNLQSTLRQHLYPEIQIELGSWLARNQIASSMIDISDGLSTDLDRICEASKVGATIYMEKVPRPTVPTALRKLQNIKGIDMDTLVLHGGDDYELLFTVPPQLERRLAKAPGPARIRRIGTIQKRRSVTIVNRDGTSERLTPEGWDPFQG